MRARPVHNDFLYKLPHGSMSLFLHYSVNPAHGLTKTDRYYVDI